MAWYRCGGGGLPAGLQSDMDTVLNKKFSTSTTYPPTDWPDTVNLLGPLPEKTASGAIANITDGADGVPLKNWLVTLPASLSGYSEVSAVRSGKNFVPVLSWFNVGYEYTHKDITFKVLADGGIKISGTSNASNAEFHLAGSASANSLYVPKNATYTFSQTGLESGVRVITSGGNGNGFPYSELTDTTTSKTGTVTNCSLPLTYLIIRIPNANTVVDTTVYIQVEVGSTATAYEPYTAPTQYTAQLGRTIYGGTADIVTGEGEATYKGFNLGALTWSGGIVGGKQWCWYCDLLSDGLKLPENSAIFDGICNDYIPIRFNGVSNNANTIALRSNGVLYVNNGSDTVQPTGNVTIALDAPETFTFTPITPTPETALGVNNFWADEGDSDVTYRADISLALQALGGGGRGLMMMRPTEPEETEETEGLEDELNR